MLGVFRECADVRQEFLAGISLRSCGQGLNSSESL
jgi:hypothetical protein